VADYPFTTLYPNLGVVRVSRGRSFVIADVPGIIEGAAEGAGLGVHFLKHLSRTHLLLHLVDMAPLDAGADLVQDVRRVAGELAKYASELADKERWLVLNKLDLLDEAEFAQRRDHLLQALAWNGPVFGISAVTGSGATGLMEALMGRLDEFKSLKLKPVEPVDDQPWHPLDACKHSV
jgi:GTP-binding protein